MSQPTPVLTYAATREDPGVSRRRKLAAAGLITLAAIMVLGLAFRWVFPFLERRFLPIAYLGYAYLISNATIGLLYCLANIALALLPLPQNPPLVTTLRFTLSGSAILVLLSSLSIAIWQMAAPSELGFGVSLWGNLTLGTFLTLARIAWLSLAMHASRRTGMLIAILASGFLLVCATLASTTCTYFLIRDFRAGGVTPSTSLWWQPTQITSIINSIATLIFAIILFLTAFRLKPPLPTSPS